MELEPGSEVDGRYVVAGEIGVGGIARVYAAQDTRLGVPVALKILMVPAASGRRRMQREGQAQASLRHPNVVQVTDIIDVGGTLGLVMELVRGPTLAELLARHRLSASEALTLARGIVSGVRAAHQLGMVHRDLKPANVLLHATGSGIVPRVADFGLVKLVTPEGAPDAVTRTGATMGSPRYMSPEQVRDAGKVDQRTDLFALGCVIYEMFCGAPAFIGDDTWEVFNAIMAGKFVSPSDLANPPDHVVAAIRACLEPDPDKRIASCDALLDLIGDVDPNPWKPETLAAVEAYVQRMPGGAPPEADTWQGTLELQERTKPGVLPKLPPRIRPSKRPTTPVRIPLLEGASDMERIAALRHLKPARLPADTVLMEEGERDPSLLVLLEGRVELRRGAVDIAEAGPGSLVGATDLLTGEPRMATVRTTEDTKVLVLHAAGYQAMATAGNHVAHAIELGAVTQMARRLREMEAALALVAPGEPVPEIDRPRAGMLDRLRKAVATDGADGSVDAVAVLRRNPILRDRPARVIEQLAAPMTGIRVDGGTTFFKKGSESERLWMHADGRVAALLPVRAKGVTVLASPAVGLPFGVAALFDDAPHRWTAVADGPCSALCLERAQWSVFLEGEDATASAFRVMLAHALRARYLEMMLAAVRHETRRRKEMHDEVAKLMGADADAIPESQFRHFGIGGHRN